MSTYHFSQLTLAKEVFQAVTTITDDGKTIALSNIDKLKHPVIIPVTGRVVGNYQQYIKLPNGDSIWLATKHATGNVSGALLITPNKSQDSKYDYKVLLKEWIKP